jgi:hypothetical protein
MKKTLFFFAFGVLVAAVIFQIVGASRVEQEKPRPPLKTVLPAELAGWTAVDQPIAETAEMQRAVGELLNYDDAILRSYRRGGQQFDVYAAYWKPGKMSERLVAGHSPDVCWVAAGWSMVTKDAPAEPLALGSWAPSAGQYRVFRDGRGAMRWVVFWHVAGDRRIDYGQGVPPWWSVFSDLGKRGFGQRSSQYFVRVSANVPWEELNGDEGFRAVLRDLKMLIE